MSISDDRSQIKPCSGTSPHHHPTRRAMRKSIRTVNENFTQHHLSSNMLPILLNNKHPWSSQVENDHQPSVRAGLHTQTHGVTALRRSYWRDHTSRALTSGKNAGAFHLDGGMKDEGVTWGGWWRTDACSFRQEDVKRAKSARAHSLCVRRLSEVKVKTEG